MIDFRKTIDKSFTCLDYLMSILAVFFGFNLIIINSKKLDFAFIRTLENIIAEYKATKNITNGNLRNMVLLILILSGFVLTSFAIPHLIDISKTLIEKKSKNTKHYHTKIVFCVII